MLDYIITNTNRDYVSFRNGCHVDSFWRRGLGKLLKKDGAAGSWCTSTMKKGVKEDLTDLTSPEHNVPLGTGELDIPGILRAAKKIGIKHYVIEYESSDNKGVRPPSIAYLKSLTK